MNLEESCWCDLSRYVGGWMAATVCAASHQISRRHDICPHLHAVVVHQFLVTENEHCTCSSTSEFLNDPNDVETALAAVDLNVLHQ